MSRSDRIALIISLVGVIASFLVHEFVFESIPHIEDEIAYVWQARVIAAGKLTIPTPPHPKSFLVPFVVDYHGNRFGKYPLGWPAVLAIGERLGIRFLVNPLLGGLSVWLTYLLGKRVFSARVALLAAGLTVLSPFFLMNSGSLLSHPLGLALSAWFALAWLDGFGERTAPRKWLPTLGAAFALGGLAITRPYTAAAIAFPFALHGLYLFVRGDKYTRFHLIVLALVASMVSSIHFLWQYIATGNPMLNLYTLWWPYDTVGFGPGHGHREQGHTLEQAFINTGYSLLVGAQDLFGWGYFSWIFLPLGILAARKNGKGLLLGSVFPSIVFFYLFYWIGSYLFGPRYFYEALYSLTLLSAAGISYLIDAQWPQLRQKADPGIETTARGHGWSYRLQERLGWLKEALKRISQNWQRLVFALLALLVAYNLFLFLPYRMKSMYGLYEMSRSDIEPFLTPEAQALTPALIIVHPGRWMPYGVLLDLQDPFLTTPFIFALSRGKNADAALAEDFPDRKVFHYYPVTEPYKFYTGPRPTR